MKSDQLAKQYEKPVWHWSSDGPPTTVEFEQIEPDQIEYRRIETDIFTTKDEVTCRRIMTLEEARKKWREPVERVGDKRVA
jgi:hypothetical protein